MLAVPIEHPAITIATLDTPALLRNEDPHLMRTLSDQVEVLIRLERKSDGHRSLYVEYSRTGCVIDGTVGFEIGAGGAHMTDIEAPTRPTVQRRAQEHHRPRVLVIQGSQEDREFIHEALSPQYDLTLANSGFEALSLVLADRPDLVILDLVLTGVSGFQILHALSRSGDAPPVIVTVGRA
ncbi:MAG: response regulator [Myxococcales bacterium]|nr:response regulator [Myxococcales bacterium]